MNSTPVTARLVLISPTSRLAWFSPATYSREIKNPFPVSKATETLYNLPASSASCKNVREYAFINIVVPLWEQGQIYLLIFEYSNICFNIILTFTKFEHIGLRGLHFNPSNMLDIGNNYKPYSVGSSLVTYGTLRCLFTVRELVVYFVHLFMIYWRACSVSSW
jgi:hypothetical protein